MSLFIYRLTADEILFVFIYTMHGMNPYMYITNVFVTTVLICVYVYSVCYFHDCIFQQLISKLSLQYRQTYSVYNVINSD